MDKVTPPVANEAVLRLYAAELAAELAFKSGDYASASTMLQTLLDGGAINKDDKGWYLQEMARYRLSDAPARNRSGSKWRPITIIPCCSSPR